MTFSDSLSWQFPAALALAGVLFLIFFILAWRENLSPLDLKKTKTPTVGDWAKFLILNSIISLFATALASVILFSSYKLLAWPVEDEGVQDQVRTQVAEVYGLDLTRADAADLLTPAGKSVGETGAFLAEGGDPGQVEELGSLTLLNEDGTQQGIRMIWHGDQWILAVGDTDRIEELPRVDG